MLVATTRCYPSSIAHLPTWGSTTATTTTTTTTTTTAASRQGHLQGWLSDDNDGWGVWGFFFIIPGTGLVILVATNWYFPNTCQLQYGWCCLLWWVGVGVHVQIWLSGDCGGLATSEVLSQVIVATDCHWWSVNKIRDTYVVCDYFAWLFFPHKTFIQLNVLFSVVLFFFVVVILWENFFFVFLFSFCFLVVGKRI